MTEKQFWMELDQGAGVADKMLEMARILRQAYDENLGIICGVRHITTDTLNQLYINLNEAEPCRDNNRYMLCYSSREMGRADPLLTEPCERLPVKFVIDNALNKPVIGGLLELMITKTVRKDNMENKKTAISQQPGDGEMSQPMSQPAEIRIRTEQVRTGRYGQNDSNVDTA